MDSVRERGAQLISISPQTVENNRELVDKYRLKFEILRDPGNEYAQQLDLRHGFNEALQRIYVGFGADLAEVNGEPSWTLPIPAHLVIGTDQKILSIEYDADYTHRPEPESLLEKLPS